MLPIISASVIWDWQFKSDHSPVAANLFTIIHQVHYKVERPAQPPWRLLLAEVADKENCTKINEEIIIKIDPFKEFMEATRSQLLRDRQAATDRDKMDPGLARAIIESAYIAIEKNMLEAIP